MAILGCHFSSSRGGNVRIPGTSEDDEKIRFIIGLWISVVTTWKTHGESFFSNGKER